MTNRQTAEQAYIQKHAEAHQLIQRLTELLDDLPAPETVSIHWGHVGDLGRVTDLLTEAVKFLDRSQS